MPHHMDELDLESLANHFGGGKKNKRSEKGGVKQSEALLAKDLSTTAVMETVGKDEKLVWYPELPKQLVDATRDKNKTEDEAIYIKSREAALKELETRIPGIREKVKEFKFQVYWSGKILFGYKETTPFGDPQNGLKFLRDELKVGKSGVDEPVVGERRTSEAKPVEKSGKNEEMSFEDKMKMVEAADYGGSLFPAFKKYVNGEALPVGLEVENVMSQIGKLFPFDVKKFAGEMRSRRENAEKPVVEWEGKYKDEQLFQTLKKVVNEDLWQKKMEELSVLDEVTRDNKLKILMALIKIKSEGMTTVEAWRLWDSQKSKLEELGLML